MNIRSSFLVPILLLDLSSSQIAKAKKAFPLNLTYRGNHHNDEYDYQGTETPTKRAPSNSLLLDVHEH